MVLKSGIEFWSSTEATLPKLLPANKLKGFTIMPTLRFLSIAPLYIENNIEFSKFVTRFCLFCFDLRKFRPPYLREYHPPL